MGLDSECSMAKWEFVAKEEGEVSGWNITERKHQG